ncbi:unnamed protein product [Trichobilharzia regenti]|nr:unnamed protein product [Trichobilharzia regenti]
MGPVVIAYPSGLYKLLDFVEKVGRSSAFLSVSDDESSLNYQVIDKWFQLITDVCQQGPGSCIAVHCKAGLEKKVQVLCNINGKSASASMWFEDLA